MRTDRCGHAVLNSVLFLYCAPADCQPCLPVTSSPDVDTASLCPTLPISCFLRLSRWAGSPGDAILSLRWLWQQTLQKLPSPSKASSMCWTQGSASRRALCKSNAKAPLTHTSTLQPEPHRCSTRTSSPACGLVWRSSNYAQRGTSA